MRTRSLRYVRIAAAYFCLGAALWAHAILTDSSPTPRANIAGPNIEIRLKFNSRIDGPHSRLYVAKADAVRQIPIGPQTAADTVSGEAKNLEKGQYQLRWQVLAADGHITRGEFPFTVH